MRKKNRQRPFEQFCSSNSLYIILHPKRDANLQSFSERSSLIHKDRLLRTGAYFEPGACLVRTLAKQPIDKVQTSTQHEIYPDATARNLLFSSSCPRSTSVWALVVGREGQEGFKGFGFHWVSFPTLSVVAGIACWLLCSVASIITLCCHIGQAKSCASLSLGHLWRTMAEAGETVVHLTGLAQEWDNCRSADHAEDQWLSCPGTARQADCVRRCPWCGCQ